MDTVRQTLLTYDKEVGFYSEILPSLMNFEEELRGNGCEEGVKGLSIADMLVEFYGIGIVGGNMCLVMERFSQEHFYVKVRNEFHEQNEVECALKHIARFHATSYAMKTVKKIHFPTAFPILTERLFHPECPAGIKAFFVSSFDANLKLVNAILHEVREGNPVVARFRPYVELLGGNFMDRLGALSGNLWPIMCRLATQEDHASVVCHGDFHMGNIAFHKNDMNTLKMFDFQVARYTSPLTDVLQYLYQVTTPQTRRQNCDHFLNMYRQSFNSTCASLGAGEHAAAVFTEEFLRGEYRRVSLWGFLYGFMFVMRRFVCGDGWAQLDGCRTSWEVVGVMDMLELWDVVSVYFDLLVEANDNKTF